MKLQFNAETSGQVCINKIKYSGNFSSRFFSSAASSFFLLSSGTWLNCFVLGHPIGFFLSHLNSKAHCGIHMLSILFTGQTIITTSLIILYTDFEFQLSFKYDPIFHAWEGVTSSRE
jgi:hypothetical protein